MLKGWMRGLVAALCACALLALPHALAEADGAKAREITKQCAFKVSGGERKKLLDGHLGTGWIDNGDNAYVGVKLPEDVSAGWLSVEWRFDPTGFELMEYDGSMNLLRQRDQDDTFPNIYTLLELLPEARYLQLKMTAPDQCVCRMRVYSRGELPSDVQQWNPPVAKADLMVVSTHQDDEVVFMGGTIPYYATALGRPTVVVYMTNCTRPRRGEALSCLWKMGVKDYPDFINLKDERVGSIKEGIRLWGGQDNILSLLAERIRRFKPEVIVTHDLNGEYGHNQHKITARAMKYAIDAAADPARYPESARRFGVWQVKKLYLHLYGENEIMMDWETPMDGLNGYTPLKVAQIGMNEQASQLKYYRVLSHGTYDNAKYGLYYTTVGPDVAKDDFLEHIDPDASERYIAEHPEAVEAVTQRLTPGNGNATAGETPASSTAPPDGEAAAPEAEPTQAAPADIEPTDTEPSNTEPAQAEPTRAEPAAAEPAAAYTAAPTPDATAVPTPAAANEKGGGGAGLAIACIASGVAIAGAGGWVAARRLGTRRRRRRRGRASR